MKQVFLMCVVVCASQLANATTFFNRSAQIGCGTITSVRALNQAPLYNQEYELSVASRTNTTDVSSAAAGFGIIGLGVATAASLVADAVIDANIKPIEVHPPADGIWKNVFAVGIVLDDGRKINLPLMNADKLNVGHQYEIGQRLHLTYHKQLNNIQTSPTVIRTPKPGEDMHAFYCGLRANKDEADAIVKASENLVNESNLIQ